MPAQAPVTAPVLAPVEAVVPIAVQPAAPPVAGKWVLTCVNIYFCLVYTTRIARPKIHHIDACCMCSHQMRSGSRGIRADVAVGEKNNVADAARSGA